MGEDRGQESGERKRNLNLPWEGCACKGGSEEYVVVSSGWYVLPFFSQEEEELLKLLDEVNSPTNDGGPVPLLPNIIS